MHQNERAVLQMQNDIVMRGYSDQTLEVYTLHLEKFLKFCNRPAEELTELDARRFLWHLLNEQKMKPNTINVYNAAIRFFFGVTMNRTMNYLQMPRMKRGRKLPVVLSKSEVNTLVSICDSLKYKALFLLTYGSGLRASEAISIRTTDIDSKSMRVFLRDAKGMKDRYTILSESALLALRDYWKKYRPKNPENYVFPAQGNVGHISATTVHFALKETVKKAKISKNISMHTFRHCFGTHLLEDGVSLLQIKEMMGHASISSTALYLHLADNTSGVTSPADRLNGISNNSHHD